MRLLYYLLVQQQRSDSCMGFTASNEEMEAVAGRYWRKQTTCEFWGFHAGEDSSRDLLSCDTV